MNSRKRFKSTGKTHALILAALTLAGARVQAADPFEDIIRKTEPLTPAEEQKKFHLPPGFVIELVASEPQIAKPMNMAFDPRGRLWITQSREYPFPVLPVENPGRDAVQVLQDFDNSGRAGRVTQFATGLNIPIGLLPYKRGVLVFSIPNIYYLEDTDNDGRADRKELILGRFGYEKDTHGLTSNFRRGFDGWVYADHGFNNDSTITAKDGSSIQMNSGNTYRFRTDGSRVEQFSHGQVNPFGLMFDHYGDLWSSDCHSSPTYLLLRGGFYPSFGKPHDGLGFAPNICTHQHGSTAIAGMVFYAADGFPAEFRNNTFIGNVMTCKINRDSYPEHGSTRIAKEEPDFLTCDDPWFRPVDLQLGPDGALYVADFYNRIIGHYEVPLTHPGRDRERGRIWRIRYVKGSAQPGNPASFDLSRRTVAEAVAELGSDNIARRMLAMNYLADEKADEAQAPLRAAVQKALAASTPEGERLLAHALWVQERSRSLDDSSLLAAGRGGVLGRVHVLRILTQRGLEQAARPGVLSAGLASFVRGSLRDPDAFVRRSAAQTLGAWAAPAQFPLLLAAWKEAPAEDSELIYTVRMALRDILQGRGDSFSNLGTLGEWESRALAEIAPSVGSPGSAAFLFRHVGEFDESKEKLGNYLRHIVRHAPETDLAGVIQFTRVKFAGDLDFQLALFKSIEQGSEQRGLKPGAGLREWGAELAGQLLTAATGGQTWFNHAHPQATKAGNPWFLQKRASSDGNQDAIFLSSLPPGGEALTGILRSKKFTIPPMLKFFLAGHDGRPPQPAGKKNVVQLLDATSGEILAQAAPPRNDTARPVSWNLEKVAGRQGVLEVIDGDTGAAYAWLAIGRLEPVVVPLPQLSPNVSSERTQLAADLARSLKLVSLAPSLARLAAMHEEDETVRLAAARALVAVDPGQAPVVGRILSDPAEPIILREQIGRALGELNSRESAVLVAEAARTAPQKLQSKLAAGLAGTPAGAEILLEEIAAGRASPQLLQEKSVSDRLKTLSLPALSARAAELSKGLAPADERLQKLMDERRAGFVASRADPAVGAGVFEKACMACHQLGGKGAVVGPQLDGVGGRGMDRLVEDILDPNRNVDAAFRYSTVTLKDDTVVTGLFRRTEGELEVFVDTTGREISIPRSKIQERVESQRSLMPDNFSEILSPAEFNHLLAFLLGQKK